MHPSIIVFLIISLVRGQTTCTSTTDCFSSSNTDANANVLYCCGYEWSSPTESTRVCSNAYQTAPTHLKFPHTFTCTDPN